MKRCSIVVFAVLIVITAASALMAQALVTPNGYQTFTMQRGWYGEHEAWYIATDINNIRAAQGFNGVDPDMTLAPKLGSAVSGGAPRVYVSANSTQPWVFTSAPGLGSYSGIWRMYFVNWLTTPRPYTGANLPTPAEAQLIPTNVIVDAPILAVGPLGGPWVWAPSRPRIPQGRVLSNYAYTKQIQLPFYYAYCQDQLTRRVSTVRVIAPDIANAALARQLGANYAPGLNGVPQSDTQQFAGFIDSPPPTQYPILEFCPTSLDWRNTNFNYSPVMIATILQRTTTQPWSIINNWTTVEVLLDSGALNDVAVTRINAPVVQLYPK